MADFYALVQGWTTWLLQSYYYVCAVPDNKNTYLLFVIDWDDNWGHWERTSCGAVKGVSSHEEATKPLLKHFAESRLENEDSGEWYEFLKGLLAQ